jgi:hypothetical protein
MIDADSSATVPSGIRIAASATDWISRQNLDGLDRFPCLGET